MGLFTVNIGYNNCVARSRIVSIIGVEAAPTRRLKDEAQRAGRLIDGTNGRRTRSVIVMDSSHVVLSALDPATLAERMEPEGDSKPFA